MAETGPGIRTAQHWKAAAPFLAVSNLVTKREIEWHDLSDVSMASYELDRKKQAEVLLVLAQSILKQEEAE